MQVTDDMVSRFLTWNLPQDFAPDGGVSFKPVNHPNAWPVGTNLLTATQARALLEHVLVVSPLPAGTHTFGSIMLTALETIATLPLEDQDNMMAANMRHVARLAIDCRQEKPSDGGKRSATHDTEDGAAQTALNAVNSAIPAISAVRELEFQQAKTWALQEQILTVRKALAAAKADGGCMVPISLLQAMTGGAACARCGLPPGCPDCRAVHDVGLGA